MEYIVTAKQMQEIDSRTIKDLGIPGMVLMERAGLSVTDEVLKMYRGTGPGKIVIFCGAGNNGGDGYVVARELAGKNIPVIVYILAKKEKLSGDALTNYRLIESLDIKIRFVTSEKDKPGDIRNFVIAVDALLGTGAKGNVRGLYRNVIEDLNESGIPVVSVDIPSGIDADTGLINGVAVKAAVTITMGLPKFGLYLSPGRKYSGKIIVADIGFPEKTVCTEKLTVFRYEDDDIKKLLPVKQLDDHKGDNGKVFTVAGSPGLTGAAYLAGKSVILSGAGLSIVGVPASLNAILENKLTETMTVPLDETEDEVLGRRSFGSIKEKLKWADVVAAGPGLGRNPSTQALIKKIVKECPVPLILDADGLFPFSGKPELLKDRKSDLIITPHNGEFARLMGVDIEEVRKNTIELLKKAAYATGATVLLKGATTLIAQTNGKTVFNITGSPGMASGGSGDVLTGIIASLAGQKMTPDSAAVCGAYIFGKAGELAAGKFGLRGMTAEDIMNFLPEVFKKYEQVD